MHEKVKVFSNTQLHVQLAHFLRGCAWMTSCIFWLFIRHIPLNCCCFQCIFMLQDPPSLPRHAWRHLGTAPTYLKCCLKKFWSFGVKNTVLLVKLSSCLVDEFLELELLTKAVFKTQPDLTRLTWNPIRPDPTWKRFWNFLITSQQKFFYTLLALWLGIVHAIESAFVVSTCSGFYNLLDYFRPIFNLLKS